MGGQALPIYTLALVLDVAASALGRPRRVDRRRSVADLIQQICCTQKLCRAGTISPDSSLLSLGRGAGARFRPRAPRCAAADRGHCASRAFQ
jgi:hypothetical protein